MLSAQLPGLVRSSEGERRRVAHLGGVPHRAVAACSRSAASGLAARRAGAHPRGSPAPARRRQRRPRRAPASARRVRRSPRASGPRRRAPRRTAAREPSPRARPGRAQALRQLGDHLPARRALAGLRDRLAQALDAPVGVGDRALLLGVGPRPGRRRPRARDALGQEARVRDDRARALASAAVQRGALGVAPRRLARLAGRPAAGTARSARRRRAPPAIAGASRPSASASRRPGPAFGSTPASRRPRPLAWRGFPAGPAPSISDRATASRRCSSSARAALGPAGAGGEALARDDHAAPRRPARARRARGSSRSAARSAPERALERSVPCRRTPLRRRRSRIGASTSGSQSSTSTHGRTRGRRPSPAGADRQRALQLERQRARARESTCGEPSASRISRASSRPSSLVAPGGGPSRGRHE